jgi:protease-4
MASGNSWTKSLFMGIWSVLNTTRKIFFNLIFLGLFIGLIIIVMGDDGKIIVPDDTALILNLNGDLVIEQRTVDPFDEFMQEAFDQKDDNPEILLQDLILAIDNAKQDGRIKALILELHGLRSAGLDKLQQVANAIESFKESEKPVYAIGDYFSQDQYYIASHADHLYLNPMGWMLLEGYGRFRMYYKDALDKLKATTHIFKVGTYKSAIEPYIRNDMSDAAREANQAWLDSLWYQYKQDVAAARGFPAENFDDKIESCINKF